MNDIIILKYLPNEPKLDIQSKKLGIEDSYYNKLDGTVYYTKWIDISDEAIESHCTKQLEYEASLFRDKMNKLHKEIELKQYLDSLPEDLGNGIIRLSDMIIQYGVGPVFNIRNEHIGWTTQQIVDYCLSEE